MSKAMYLVFLAVTLASPLWAQTPAGDVSASYAIFGQGAERPGLRGGNLTTSFNLGDRWGITGDLGVYEGSGDLFLGGIDLGGINVVFPPGVPDFTRAYIRVVTFGVGPRLSYRNRSPFTPYAQVLLGLEHTDTSLALLPLSASTNHFVTQIGGGVDVQLARHWAVRLIELSLPISFNPTDVFHIDGRVSAGIVYRFGSR
jgi:opacity protein-like surface antigen